jgi:hypothetical protein
MKKKSLSRQEAQALAKSLHRHRGDLSAWSAKPVSAKVGKERGGIMFSIRFTRDELDTIRYRAAEEKIPISTLIKRSVLEMHQPTTMIDLVGYNGQVYVPNTEMQYGYYPLAKFHCTFEKGILEKLEEKTISDRFADFFTSQTSGSTKRAAA